MLRAEELCDGMVEVVRARERLRLGHLLFGTPKNISTLSNLIFSALPDQRRACMYTPKLLVESCHKPLNSFHVTAPHDMHPKT